VKHSTMPLPRYSAYIFDLDGTIYLGDALLPGAAETIARLRTGGSKVLFLSNNPTRTRAQYAAKLTALGIPTTPDAVINSSYVMVRWLQAEAPGSRIFVIGEQPLCERTGCRRFRPGDRCWRCSIRHCIIRPHLHLSQVADRIRCHSRRSALRRHESRPLLSDANRRRT
jgi:hypothetical protein